MSRPSDPLAAVRWDMNKIVDACETLEHYPIPNSKSEVATAIRRLANDVLAGRAPGVSLYGLMLDSTMLAEAWKNGRR